MLLHILKFDVEKKVICEIELEQEADSEQTGDTCKWKTCFLVSKCESIYGWPWPSIGEIKLDGKGRTNREASQQVNKMVINEKANWPGSKWVKMQVNYQEKHV